MQNMISNDKTNVSMYAKCAYLLI